MSTLAAVILSTLLGVMAIVIYHQHQQLREARDEAKAASRAPRDPDPRRSMGTKIDVLMRWGFKIPIDATDDDIVDAALLAYRDSHLEGLAGARDQWLKTVDGALADDPSEFVRGYNEGGLASLDAVEKILRSTPHGEGLPRLERAEK